MNNLNEGTHHGNGESNGAKEQYRHGSPIEKTQRVRGNKKVDVIFRPTPIATGPRTPAGKQRTKYNATKHGIFSAIVVLETESQAHYDALLNGLLNAWQPVGAAEELLVEKMAMNLWRHRRLLIAEGAEIRKGQEFQESAWKQQLRSEAEEQARKRRRTQKQEDGSTPDPFTGMNEGLIWRAENREILDCCLELLGELRKEFKANGFSSEMSESLLEKIYGERGRDHLRKTLYDVCGNFSDMAKGSEQEGYPSPAECKKNALQAIDSEIERLKRSQKELLQKEALHIEMEKLRHSVPDMPALERLQRYETTLERAFDRALIQLERLQRMRLGQPVPPPLKVEVSKN